MRQQRADSPPGTGGTEEVTLGEEGAVEVTEQDGRDLHVQGVQVFEH